jgi:hypothetical protein
VVNEVAPVRSTAGAALEPPPTEATQRAAVAAVEATAVQPTRRILNLPVRSIFFREDDRQIVHLGDGRKFIEDSKEKYDSILLDAFSALSIPHALTTQEFLKAVRARLAAGGAVCANLWEGATDYPDMLKTYSTVFREVHVVRCLPNVVLLALPNKMDLTNKAWADRAAAFEKKHLTGLDLPQLIDRGAAEQTDIPANAKVLRDKDKDSTSQPGTRRDARGPGRPAVCWHRPASPRAGSTSPPGRR